MSFAEVVEGSHGTYLIGCLLTMHLPPHPRASADGDTHARTASFAVVLSRAAVARAVACQCASAGVVVGHQEANWLDK